MEHTYINRFLCLHQISLMSHLADTKYSTNGNFAKQKLSSLNKKKMLIGNELNAQNIKNKREREKVT